MVESMVDEWYIGGMKAKIDGAGRIVIPKQLRDDLGFRPGTELELSARDGILAVEVPSAKMWLEEGEYGVVARTDREMPTLTADQARETLESVRR